jgi:hypothetical protein
MALPLDRSFSFMRSRSSALHREQHHNGSAAIRDSSHGCLSQKNATECRRPAVGQWRDFNGLPMTSGFPPEADIVTAGRHVSKVPCVDGSELARTFFHVSSIGRCSHVFGL